MLREIEAATDSGFPDSGFCIVDQFPLSELGNGNWELDVLPIRELTGGRALWYNLSKQMKKHENIILLVKWR